MTALLRTLGFAVAVALVPAHSLAAAARDDCKAKLVACVKKNDCGKTPDSKACQGCAELKKACMDGAKPPKGKAGGKRPAARAS
jgi:hypothetical protein